MNLSLRYKGVHGRLSAMENKKKAAEAIRDASPEEIEKMGEVLGRSSETVMAMGKHPKKMTDEQAALLRVVHDAWPKSEE